MEKFDAKVECDNIINFVRDYYTTHNLKGAVLGISGGKDSGVVAGLLVKALGKDNVVGVSMPCHSDTLDRDLASVLSKHYGFKLMNVDLTPVYDTFINSVGGVVDNIDKHNLNSNINLKPRLRMSTLYYMAALLSSVNGGTYLVAGTSNKCELFVGYFTKGGDNVNDISIIADYTVDEVIALGEYIGVPKDILYRVPSDGLSGVSDEDKLGVSYKDIAIYMDNPNSLERSALEKIQSLHRNSRHKFVENKYVRSGK